MAIRNLIDGQTIKIDNHNSGTEFKWGEGIHLHKRMNKDKLSGANVIIYIDDDKEIEFRNVKGSEKIKKRIKNEIKNAFEDRTIRKSFIVSFYKALRLILDACNIKVEKDRCDKAQQAADLIAKHFELKQEAKKHFSEMANDFFVFSDDEKQADVYVALNSSEKSICVGRELNIVKEMVKK